MIGQDKLAEERKRRSIELEQAIKEYGNAQKASWKPRASRDSPLPGRARLDKAMRKLEVAVRKVIDADLARAVGMRQAQCFMPLVAFPEAPRPAAKPRSKSGQRRAHARWGR